MVSTLKGFPVTTIFRYEVAAPMATHIDKRPQRAFVIHEDDERRGSRGRRDEVARSLQILTEACELPCAPKDSILLESEDRRVRVPPSG